MNLQVQGAKLQIGDGVIECDSEQPSADDLRRFACALSDRVDLTYAAPQQEDEPEARGF